MNKFALQRQAYRGLLQSYRVSLSYRQYRRLSSTRIYRESSQDVRVLEVGPRDGLQNIKQFVPTDLKIELIRRLAATGLTHIETTSFVSPKWVPQLSDGERVMKETMAWVRQQDRQFRLPVLAPNPKGLQRAIASGANEVVIFSSATDEFVRRNQNCTLEEGLDAAQKVATEALKNGMTVRGVISCIFVDPYTGPADPERALYVINRLLEMGCYEVGLGDTTGVGTPYDTRNLLKVLLQEIPADKLAGHFHDTYGQALANVAAAYDMGIRKFDSSIAGLGGCPYAKGAKGNMATEDMVYMFEKSGISTGIDLEQLSEVGDWISKQLGFANGSRAGAALVTKKASSTTPDPAPAETAIPTTPKRTWAVVEDRGDFVVSRAGSTAKVTLNRPRYGNNLTVPMLEGLTEVIHNLSNDKSIFSIVFTAEGKNFCTGMDLSGGTDVGDVSRENSYYSKVAALYNALENAPQTTIAAVNGPAFGGGVGLTFTCDIRLASTNARWTLSEIKLGLSPAIISKYMSREWGYSFFREAMLTGREVNPQELVRIGAVHGVARDADSLNTLVDEYLDRLEGCAPQSAAACKKLVHLAWTDAGGKSQEEFIQHTFDNMTAPGSEGQFGFEQFQKKVRKIDWSRFWKKRRVAGN